jgi:hypothetical protein
MTNVSFIVNGKEYDVDSFSVVGYVIKGLEQVIGRAARLYLELPKASDEQQAVKGEVVCVRHFVCKDVAKFLVVKVIQNNAVKYMTHHGTFETFTMQQEFLTANPKPSFPEYWVFDKPVTTKDLEKITGEVILPGVVGYTGGEVYKWVEANE